MERGCESSRIGGLRAISGYSERLLGEYREAGTRNQPRCQSDCQERQRDTERELMTTGWTGKHYEMMTAERDKAIAERDRTEAQGGTVRKLANPNALGAD